MNAAAVPSGAVPPGTVVEPDRHTRSWAPGSVLGGAPTRIMRLSTQGTRAWEEIEQGLPTSPEARVLASRLIRAGVIHPLPGRAVPALDITVVVPVRDRPHELRRCLTALDSRSRTIVVDDGSSDPTQTRHIARSHGADVVVRGHTGGPAAARNTGLARVTTPFVAFVDSDCTPSRDWLELLTGHFGDPSVAAVAPRVLPEGVRHRWPPDGGLDMGPDPAEVGPRRRVPYVPTAALVVRRAALWHDPAFDPRLRYGEDVDLIWRLIAAGWRVRYEPAATVRHAEPRCLVDYLARRYHYGTAAGPLAHRHPGSLAPLVLTPGPAVAVGAALAGRPTGVVAGLAVEYGTVLSAVHDRGGPAGLGDELARRALVATWRGVGRYLRQFGLPIAAAAVASRRGSTVGRLARRAAMASLLLAPPRPTGRGSPRPGRGVYRVVGDVAYGAGVVAGCARARTIEPLLPRFEWRRWRRGPRHPWKDMHHG